MDAEMDEVKKMYIDFKKSLMLGDIEKFYDEVELLNIYDYAGDENDLFVQFEILRLAARLFPDSPEFGSRGAFFLKEILDESDGAKALSEQHKDDSFVWTVLNLSFEGDSELVKSGLEKVLSVRHTLEDEDVLRLVDLCSDYNLQNWAYENYEKILAMCAYPDTFLLELAEVFYNQGNNDIAIELLEKLTEIQPFNAAVWSRLADIQALNHNLDNALTAIDYAIAIEPEKLAYRVQRVKLKYYCATPSDKDISQLYAVIDKDPENRECINLLFAIMIDRGEYSKIIDMMMGWLDECNDNSVAVDIAEKLFLLNNRPVISQIIGDYFMTGKFIVPDKLEWAREQFQNGCYAACAEIILSLIGNPVAKESWDMLFESLYRIRDYNKIAELFVDSESGIRLAYKDSENQLFTMFIVALALARCRHYEEFCEIANFLLDERPVVVEDFKQRLAASATFSILHAILQFISTGKDFDIDSFDPFSE